MAGRIAMDLEADEVVDTAIAILREAGLAAVSMRNVGARLGVSPVPLYRRVGGKDDLLAAMAARLLSQAPPAPRPGEPWQQYAARWATALRKHLRSVRDLSPLLTCTRREAYVEASRPLVAVLRAAGFSAPAAVQSARLIVYSTVGFSFAEGGAAEGDHRPGLPGSDPRGITRAEVDHLFQLEIRYVISGIDDDHGREPAPAAPRRRRPIAAT